MNTPGLGGPPAVVAEIQGLYGPFSFPEKLLQQIWSRREFDIARARTNDGRLLEVLHPGRWNLLGGPDFKAARLRLGGEMLAGDVEVHLRVQDWASHGHARDAAYREVVLHVVLFPTDEEWTPGFLDARIPVLVLLPLLHHDLEEFATDEAIERLSNHPLARAHRELACLPPEALSAELFRQAARRWRQKVRYATVRLQKLGWEQACHHAALEILGYRFNRSPMLAVASAFPLSRWRAENPDVVAEEAYAFGAGRWSVQGVRPANQPRRRLRQYASWVRQVPQWPARLESSLSSLPQSPSDGSPGAAIVRRAGNLSSWREGLAQTVAGGAVSGPRWDTLLCDGFLPLIAARAAAAGDLSVDHVLQRVWAAWYPGDCPASFSQLLRELGVVRAPAEPLSNGSVQGLLGWLLQQDANNSASKLPSEGVGLDKV